jgi:hypothetical protein
VGYWVQVCDQRELGRHSVGVQSSVVGPQRAPTGAQVGAGNLLSPPVHLRYAALGLMASRRLQARLLGGVTGGILSRIWNCAAQVCLQHA